LLLVAFCISSSLAYDLSSYRLASRVQLPNVQLHLQSSPALRAKRDATINKLEDPDSCIKNCTYKLHDALDNMNDTDSQMDVMVGMCQATEPMEACYKACPESQFRKLLLDFMPLMKQPCLLGGSKEKITELTTSLDCLNTTAGAIGDKCDPVCNGSFAGDIRLNSHIVLNVDPAFIIYDDDKAENRNVLKSTCSYIACTQQCGDPISKAQCGQKAVEVDHKITSSIFGSITKLYSDVGALDGDVKECTALL